MVAHSMAGKLALALTGSLQFLPTWASPQGCMSVPISSHQLPQEAIILEGKAKVAMA